MQLMSTALMRGAMNLQEAGPVLRIGKDMGGNIEKWGCATRLGSRDTLIGHGRTIQSRRESPPRKIIQHSNSLHAASAKAYPAISPETAMSSSKVSSDAAP